MFFSILLSFLLGSEVFAKPCGLYDDELTVTPHLRGRGASGSCPLQTFISSGKGVAWTDPGFSYATYHTMLPAPTPTTTAAADPLCTPYEAPEDGVKPFCQCISGTIFVTMPYAASTGSNTGTKYNACPYTKIPSITTTKVSIQTMNTPQYAFTYTDIYSNVIECQSSSLAFYGGLPETMCAGSSAIIHAGVTPTLVSPSVTVEIGQIPGKVGTLTGTALYTSISSALDSICPSVTKSGPVACGTDTVSIPHIDYIQSDETRGLAKLVVSVPAGNYSDPKIRVAMIQAAAVTAQNSATGKNCQEQSYENCDGKGPCSTEKIELCNSAGFAGVQYYDGVQTNAAMYLNTNWDFELDSSDVFDCEFVVELVEAALLELAPEFAIGDTVAEDALLAICGKVTEE